MTDEATLDDLVTRLRDEASQFTDHTDLWGEAADAIAALRERIGMLEAYAPPVHIRGGPRDPVAMWFDRAKELEAERDALREWVKRHG